MEYYHDNITRQSYAIIQQLNREYNFVLIGGWAVFLYANTLKSKDIDIIIDYGALSKLKENFEVLKNERLKKYEIKHFSGVDIDIYLPHYSDLGIDADEIMKDTLNIGGFDLPQLEYLFLLKLYAYTARRGSLKGKKDELDIFSLAFLPQFDWEKYQALIAKHDFENYHKIFIDLLSRTIEIKELSINRQKMAKIKRGILPRIK